MNLFAILTDATCGPACWEAREDICRCSCGGRNHGCLRHEHGVRPTRESRIDGFRYKLHSVGESSGFKIEQEILDKIDPKHVDGPYIYHWKATDAGSPMRVKAATQSQLASWPELAAWRERKPWDGPVYLVWRREDFSLAD